ncbi:DUF4396 domain-containing protein [Acuticoccus kandeliae]|uniref:DUF4396 domain-containing protein n=1 Tax=Acuticoccus kandeliae TaxID=2073160 RepID=UPI000D3EBFD0|nr:DUF4396 domain-containing protein [Acuticoccus kandeliae]
MVPASLHFISIASLVIAVVCAAVVAVDVVRRPQHMGIMNVVWPVVMLFLILPGIWFYWRYGRAAPPEHAMADAGMAHAGMAHAGMSHAGMSHAGMGEGAPMGGGRPMAAQAPTPFPVSVAKGALHCGAGCTVGDILAEILMFLVPSIALAFGYQSLFSERIFAVWVFDFILAFGFGIVFQYLAIVPMRGLGFVEGIVAALKADALSLTAWQVGMYGVMGIAHFWLFGAVFGVPLEASMPEFWFFMQVAMLAGLATSYPANWFLLKAGIKEVM